ncbi:PEP-CTERM sorting domain-containing protein [Microcoleus sp. MON1_C1]|uniref:PEP-CTERM sorting domain-containing protein n=1 Tax=Microcoleus sp. MON1_C1 TaxID=2818827 RepID=UPI002FD652C0
MKFQLNLVKSILAVVGVAAVSAVSAAPASAFGFGNIDGSDNQYGDAFFKDFSFDVTDGGSNNVIFNIANNTSVASMFIGSVYFDTGSNSNLLSNFGLNVDNIGKTVDFKDTGAANMSQSNNLTPAWSTDFSATKTGGQDGIHKGEVLGLSFTGNYANVVSALNTGTLRLGLHVQGIGAKGEYSDAFVSSTTNTEATPEPLTMLAAGAAVGFGTMFKKQREQAKKAE